MHEAKATFRCVCGSDIPIEGHETMVCSSCGRQHRPLEAEDPNASETVFLHRGATAEKALPAESKSPRPGGSSGSSSVKRPSLAGQTIDHFEVLEEIGHGGMGTVYRALDRSLERYVALKVIQSEEVLKNRDLVEAFTHEARAQARVNHPGVATIYYIGRFEDMTYFAMEIVPGVNLESKLVDGALPFGEVVEIGIQVVQALREAQDRGVIHRDIKPGNIIYSSSRRVKATDFGLSKTEGGGLQITGSQHITGTPSYVAPEQARGETTDFRTDIYSLGATLYHLAYGKPPFEGGNFMAVISKHMSEPLSFPKSPHKQIPPGFPLLLERMMAKDPKARFPTYDELEKALLDLRPESLIVAAFGRRAVAAMLDCAAVLIIIMGFSVPYSIVQGIVTGTVNQPSEAAMNLVASIVVGLLLGHQALRGITPGKRFARLRIARVDGRPLAKWRLAARGSLQFLLLVAFAITAWVKVKIPSTLQVVLVVSAVSALDHVWALTNRNRRTLHDLLLKTWVLDRK